MPQHAESIASAVDAAHAGAFVQLLEGRLGEMTPSGARRLRRVIEKTRSQAGASP